MVSDPWRRDQLCAGRDRSSAFRADDYILERLNDHYTESYMGVFRAALTAAVDEAKRRPPVEIEPLRNSPGIVGLSAEFVLTERAAGATASRGLSTSSDRHDQEARQAIKASAWLAAVSETRKLDAATVAELARYTGIVGEAARDAYPSSQ
jgi:hypothetical protein